MRGRLKKLADSSQKTVFEIFGVDIDLCGLELAKFLTVFHHSSLVAQVEMNPEKKQYSVQELLDLGVLRDKGRTTLASLGLAAAEVLRKEGRAGDAANRDSALLENERKEAKVARRGNVNTNAEASSSRPLISRSNGQPSQAHPQPLRPNLGFKEFLDRVKSPPNQRVTAGGRIVPFTPPTGSNVTDGSHNEQLRAFAGNIMNPTAGTGHLHPALQTFLQQPPHVPTRPLGQYPTGTLLNDATRGLLLVESTFGGGILLTPLHMVQWVQDPAMLAGQGISYVHIVTTSGLLIGAVPYTPLTITGLQYRMIQQELTMLQHQIEYIVQLLRVPDRSQSNLDKLHGLRRMILSTIDAANIQKTQIETQGLAADYQPGMWSQFASPEFKEQLRAWGYRDNFELVPVSGYQMCPGAPTFNYNHGVSGPVQNVPIQGQPFPIHNLQLVPFPTEGIQPQDFPTQTTLNQSGPKQTVPNPSVSAQSTSEMANDDDGVTLVNHQPRVESASPSPSSSPVFPKMSDQEPIFQERLRQHDDEADNHSKAVRYGSKSKKSHQIDDNFGDVEVEQKVKKDKGKQRAKSPIDDGEQGPSGYRKSKGFVEEAGYVDHGQYQYSAARSTVSDDAPKEEVREWTEAEFESFSGLKGPMDPWDFADDHEPDSDVEENVKKPDQDEWSADSDYHPHVDRPMNHSDSLLPTYDAYGAFKARDRDVESKARRGLFQ